jgi:hypothetical protein
MEALNSSGFAPLFSRRLLDLSAQTLPRYIDSTGETLPLGFSVSPSTLFNTLLKSAVTQAQSGRLYPSSG